jgi:hypothetical protein
MRMGRLISSAALATAIMASAALVSNGAHAATINYALSSDGASFVSASSVISGGCCAINVPVMDADLLTNSKTAWYFDGDTRYIFGANDPNGTIEISLGQVRQINDIGALIDLPSDGDRPVVGPVTIEVSLNGTTWTAWGSPVSISGSTTNPVSITEPTQGVEFIQYSFGPTGAPYGGFGGSAVNGIFALSPTPLPSTWTMLIAGFVGLGFLAYRGSKKNTAALAAA